MYTEDLVVPVETTELSLKLELAVEHAKAVHFEYLIEKLTEQVNSFKGQKEFLEGQIKTESDRIRTGIEAQDNLSMKLEQLQSENGVLTAEILELKPKEPNRTLTVGPQTRS